MNNGELWPDNLVESSYMTGNCSGIKIHVAENYHSKGDGTLKVWIVEFSADELIGIAKKRAEERKAGGV